MGARSRPPRTYAGKPDGRHFLRSEAVTAELVLDASIAPADHVLEIGAGDGRLTAHLARVAERVSAVELDEQLVTALRRRFDSESSVEIVHADALAVPLPSRSFRVFGNIPFGITNALLRRLLDDPDLPVQRVDVLLQFGAARKRADPWPSTALGLGWLPWWEFSLVRRVPRTAFEPAPSVDAAVLRVIRRAPALLDPADRPAYERLVRSAFRFPTWPTERALRSLLPSATWRPFARGRGIPTDATPRELDVWDWVALFDVVGAVTPPPRGGRRRSRQRSGGTTRRRS